jgi:hypothetical protein
MAPAASQPGGRTAVSALSQPRWGAAPLGSRQERVREEATCACFPSVFIHSISHLFEELGGLVSVAAHVDLLNHVWDALLLQLWGADRAKGGVQGWGAGRGGLGVQGWLAGRQCRHGWLSGQAARECVHSRWRRRARSGTIENSGRAGWQIHGWVATLCGS